jgi:hypothetical protein
MQLQPNNDTTASANMGETITVNSSITFLEETLLGCMLVADA